VDRAAHLMARHDSAPPELASPHMDFGPADVGLRDFGDQAARLRIGHLILEELDLMSFGDKRYRTFHDVDLCPVNVGKSIRFGKCNRSVRSELPVSAEPRYLVRVRSAHRGLSTAFTAIGLWTAIAFAQSSAVPTGPAAEPANLGLYKIELTKYRESGRYESGLAAVASQAAAWLAQRARRKGKLAMVLDIDETSLSNWPVIKADNFGFIPRGPCDLSKSDLPQGACGWLIWISQARDQPIKPTLELYRQARSLGVEVFFITGRPEFVRDATQRNLRAAGYEGWKDLMMAPKGLRLKSAADFKAPARKRIVEQGYSIVLNMGDQDSDLAGGYAERTFKLPDPFYYIP
jgi:hypothetical protein